MDALMSLFEGFDFANFIPDVTSVLGWLETVARIAVMAAPLVLLGFGLLYLLAPPKEANHSLGFRFWWGMASLDAWQFTQRIAGMVWMVLGLVLTIVMGILCNGFRGMEVDAMLWLAIRCILWELGIAVVSTLGIQVTVFIVFDSRGFRRRERE
jgi:uncharacterized membrane protein